LILKLDYVKFGCQENSMVEKLTKVMVEQVHAWRRGTTCITVSATMKIWLQTLH